MTWLTPITGISEDGPPSIRAVLYVDGLDLVRKIDGKRFKAGTLTTPSLAQLRKTKIPQVGPLTCTEIVADAQALHADPNNAGAVFQVASQFNLLEMISPDIAPEDGIARYANDHTQGPACAIACGAGTIYRNYFVDTGHDRTGVGQNSWYQLDMLADLADAFGNADDAHWVMQNGYALPRSGGLERVAALITQGNREKIKGLLRIGVQADTAVTISDARHTVTQIYCSALPVAYSPQPFQEWEPFARLVLEAAYEATLYAALQTNPNKPVYLTLLGGGAFGNKTSWIIEAIDQALKAFANSGLDVRIVSYAKSHPDVRPLLR